MELGLIHKLRGKLMINLGLEFVFWLILLTYVGARISKVKKNYKQQY